MRCSAPHRGFTPYHLSSKSGKGFTLVETLVAMFIMGVAVTLFGIVGTLLKNASALELEHVAVRAAHTKLDELRALGYAALPASGPFSDPLVDTLPSGAASTTVSAFNAKTKKVLVGVSWAGAGNTPRYLSLTTLVTEVGGL